MKRIGARHTSPSEKITATVFFVLFLAIAVICLYPMFWAIVNSMKDHDAYITSSTAFPSVFVVENYVNVFSNIFIIKGVNYVGMLINSLWIVVVKVFVNVASSTMLAYAVARFRFPGKEFLYVVVIFVNTIPIIGSGPAAYKLIDYLGMVNNPLTLWVTWASGFDFAFIVLYGYFKGVSPSYSEAGYIDGAGELKTFFSIVLPQIVPCLVAIMITQAIGVWNDYSTPMIYLREMPNLAYGLFEFNKTAMYETNARPVFFAATVISAIPSIILYACTQKLILTNMTAGGLKG